MWWFVIIWALVAAVWGRVYFARRCGVRFQSGVDGIFITGQWSAIMLAMAWPVTLFTHWNPKLCNHRVHLLARHQMREQFEAEESQIRATRLREGR